MITTALQYRIDASCVAKNSFSQGLTDDFGLTPVEVRVRVHNLHATILHLMVLDHERLTYRYSCRDYRLMCMEKWSATLCRDGLTNALSTMNRGVAAQSTRPRQDR